MIHIFLSGITHFFSKCFQKALVADLYDPGIPVGPHDVDAVAGHQADTRCHRQRIPYLFPLRRHAPGLDFSTAEIPPLSSADSTILRVFNVCGASGVIISKEADGAMIGPPAHRL